MRLQAVLIFSLITFLLTGCITSIDFSPKTRLYIVQEIKMNNDTSLFWFRNEEEMIHEGSSYFQFTNDKCNLSLKSANAFCDIPSQIYKINDTVFVLSYEEITPVKTNHHFFLKTTKFSFDLFKIERKPDKSKQYFLDSLCK